MPPLCECEQVVKEQLTTSLKQKNQKQDVTGRAAGCESLSLLARPETVRNTNQRSRDRPKTSDHVTGRSRDSPPSRDGPKEHFNKYIWKIMSTAILHVNTRRYICFYLFLFYYFWFYVLFYLQIYNFAENIYHQKTKKTTG